MSSAGHIFDMIARNKANEVLRKLRKDRTRKILDKYQKKIYHIEFTENKKHTKEEIRNIKDRIRSRLNREKTFVSIVVLLFLLLVTFFIGKWSFSKLF